MKTSETNKLTILEAKEMLETERMTLSRLKFNHVVSPLDDPSQIKKSRRLIARLETKLRQSELNEK